MKIPETLCGSVQHAQSKSRPMSGTEAAAHKPRETTNGDTPTIELDIAKLHSLPSEQQDLFLLTYVSELRDNVARFTKEDLPAHQPRVKKELIKIIGLSTPAPSRVIRNTIGGVFADVFSRGSRSLLYETINDLLGFVNAGKGETDLRSRQAAVVCLGYVFRAAGDSAISLSSLTCASLLRLFKQSQNHAGLRGSTYRALAWVITGIEASTDEQIARDIWKQARNGAANDKSTFAQRTACQCIEALCRLTPYFSNPGEFEGLRTTVWKAIDSSNVGVRHAAASVLAAALVKAYLQSGNLPDVPTIRKPKKASKRQGKNADEDAESERPSSPAPRKAASQLAMSLPEALRTLSVQYCRSATSNRSRAGITVCYRKVVQQLPSRTVEENYSPIADHLFSDLLNQPTVSYNRYRLLLTRKYVSNILEATIASQILSEGAQVTAARWLINDVLKNYPKVMKERREPNKRTLTSALDALTGLINNLGSAMTVMGDACREALLQVVQHSSYTVQVHAAQCLHQFVIACPQQLLPCAKQTIAQLEKEVSQLSEPRHSPRRSVAFANALAAVLSAARQRPLYGSLKAFSDVFRKATDLLKASGSSEIRTSATQVQVAWILIGGLMPLGPNFVKVHLSQLLLLWRNALPRPLTRENAAKRSNTEMSFLAHVRECALSAMFLFLQYNSSLVTTDSSRRLATLLQNCTAFLDSFPHQRGTEEVSNRLIPSLQLQDFKVMVRRRILQCFARLVSTASLENSDIFIQSDLVSLAMQSFTEVENIASRTFESSVANSVSNFEGLWELEDNWGFGVTGLLLGGQLELPDGKILTFGSGSKDWSGHEDIDGCLLSPTCAALEHDSIALYSLGTAAKSQASQPPATQLVDAAIRLFAIALPLQPLKVQESALEQIATTLSQPFYREPGRKAAMLVNSCAALLSALTVANRETEYSRGRLGTLAVEKTAAEILRRAIADPDEVVRNMGVEALGRLCGLAGSTFTNNEVNHLIETIVANRDPNIRAGCALSLGSVTSQVGGMAASFHLKTIVGVLLSLCNDPHPVVHFWAVEGLNKVADSTGLAFSAFVSSALGMLAQLYTSDSHTVEVASQTTSNLEDELSTPGAISNCIDSLVSVLGPDLQESSKARGLIMTMVSFFKQELETCVSTMASVCLGHMSLFAPAHINFAAYIAGLQSDLSSSNQYTRDIAITGLNDAMKRSAAAVFDAATPELEDQLWLTLDTTSSHSALQSIVENWLQQSYHSETAIWVQRCQSVLSKARTKPTKAAPSLTAKSAGVTTDFQDEEVAGFAAAAAAVQGEAPEVNADGQEFLKWQTRRFAMSTLSTLLDLVAEAALPDQPTPAETELQGKIADIVRMAFTASTANVVELRTLGLKIIDQILHMFGRTPDPDFLEASLLEQYQAQIGSALTPAFAADSAPELAAEAINVCATFVATGIVTNVERMGRIFKLLVTGLESCTDGSTEASIGDLKGLSSNAHVMLKMAILSGWAKLEIASTEQEYLAPIVQPYVAKLTPLWLSALQEFAQLRFEPEISSTLGGDRIGGDLDEIYAGSNRETRLRFYQDSWLSLVNAIALLVDKDSDFVFDALDNKTESGKAAELNGLAPHGKDMSFREEPVAFFFILYGLAFEALVVSAREDVSQAFAILQALRKILRPAVAGTAIYQDIVFSESMDAFDRLAMTAGNDIHGVLVDIARNMAIDHVSTKSIDDRNDKLSDDIDQLFELTRIIILVLAGLVPTLGEAPGSAALVSQEKGALLALASLEALVEVADVFPSVIKTDLHACIIHTFCTVLATGACQAEVVPQAFPIFRRFLLEVTVTSSRSRAADASRLIRGCLAQLLKILAHAQRRESDASIPCAKNTLLTITILITSAGRIIPANEPLVANAITQILDCLTDVGLGTVAGSCIRTLLLAKPKSPCEETVARLLYPRLIDFLTDSGTEDPENVAVAIVRALTGSVATLPKQGRPAALAVIVPVLLDRAEEEGRDSQKEAAARLLELAAVDPLTFRSFVGSLSEEQRSLLEEILRSNGGMKTHTDEREDDEETKPTIELRMDF